MWFEWGVRLTTILALLAIVAGLVVLALPDAMEGQEVLQLDAAHRLRVADFIGAGLVAVGALVTWLSVLAWQRKRIQQ